MEPDCSHQRRVHLSPRSRPYADSNGTRRCTGITGRPSASSTGEAPAREARRQVRSRGQPDSGEGTRQDHRVPGRRTRAGATRSSWTRGTRRGHSGGEPSEWFPRATGTDRRTIWRLDPGGRSGGWGEVAASEYGDVSASSGARGTARLLPDCAPRGPEPNAAVGVRTPTASR